jgi:3-methyladenine DNA glycosylase AlkD
MKGLLVEARRRLRAIGDAQRAIAMQAYMKSAMPFHGVPTPPRRAIARALWREHAPADAATWRTQVARLWDGATHREEWYLAIDWCRLSWKADRRMGRERCAFIDLDALPLFTRMITEGAWWDVVDEIAGHQLGILLDRHPVYMASVLRDWAVGDQMWRRRSAIVSQLDRKAATDVQLLIDCLAPSLRPSPFANQFFVAKGMGWALRQYARTDPAWVRRYLRDHAERLPALTRREAGKHL